VEYYHLVFTLPAPISEFAYYNKSVVYAILFKAAAETLCTIAADPRHLGARIGATLVLHTWGSAMTHHPHVHGIVPGGGLSLDGERWVQVSPHAIRQPLFVRHQNAQGELVIRQVHGVEAPVDRPSRK